MDLDEAVLYRLAYALAEAGAGAENYPGRWRSNPAAGGTLDAILAEVTRRLAKGREGEAEIIREGVEDALEERRPQW